MIAEDEFLIADLLQIMLEDAGYEVLVAPHGKAALTLVLEKRPQLVVTDFMMPLMTGLELARAIRGDVHLADTPIILVSGAQGSIGRAHPEMFNAVLDKPYDERKLLDVVHSVLSKFK